MGRTLVLLHIRLVRCQLLRRRLRRLLRHLRLRVDQHIILAQRLMERGGVPLLRHHQARRQANLAVGDRRGERVVAISSRPSRAKVLLIFQTRLAPVVNTPCRTVLRNCHHL